VDIASCDFDFIANDIACSFDVNCFQ